MIEMKKNIYKLFSLLLVSVICLSASVYAIDGSASAAPTEVTAGQKRMVEDLFQREFTIWNTEGEDITEEFYRTMRPAYRMGDYATIVEYLVANFERAVAPKHSDPYSTYADDDTVLVMKRCHDIVEVYDTMWKRYNNNLYYYFFALYEYRQSTNTIVDCHEPYFDTVKFQKHFDGCVDWNCVHPGASFSKIRYKKAANGAYVDYSFDYEGNFTTSESDDPYESVIDHHYEGTITYRQMAEPED